MWRGLPQECWFERIFRLPNPEIYDDTSLEDIDRRLERLFLVS